MKILIKLNILKKNKMENKEKEWKLESFKVDFKQGYSFKQDEKDKIDRYEGFITFSNKEFERFTIKLDQFKSGKIVGLISEQIVTTANELSERINKSFNQNNQ